MSALKSTSQGCWLSEAAHVDQQLPSNPQQPRHVSHFTLNASTNSPLHRNDNLPHSEGPPAFLGIVCIPFCLFVYSGKSSPLTSGVFPQPRKVGSRGMPLCLSTDKMTAATDRCPPFMCFGCFSFSPTKYVLSKQSVEAVGTLQSQDCHLDKLLATSPFKRGKIPCSRDTKVALITRASHNQGWNICNAFQNGMWKKDDTCFLWIM